MSIAVCACIFYSVFLNGISNGPVAIFMLLVGYLNQTQTTKQYHIICLTVYNMYVLMYFFSESTKQRSVFTTMMTFIGIVNNVAYICCLCTLNVLEEELAKKKAKTPVAKPLIIAERDDYTSMSELDS
jgi:hypothetical protein